ncbi:MAG TPA: hypothetical protein VGM37_15675 [Armatimonadota bacterium]|jgi:molecular chaperone HscB
MLNAEMDQVTLTNEIAPFPRGTDFFAAMGLPRRLIVDERALESTFHDLSRRFHPDRHATAGPKARIVSLENTALITKAYRTLRDPWERAAYLVDLESGGHADIASRPPTEMFEEILELQELTGDLRMALASGAPADGLRADVLRAAEPFRKAHSSLDARLADLFGKWDSVPNPREGAARAAVLTMLKELIGERRYLLRVIADIDSSLEGKPAPREV